MSEDAEKCARLRGMLASQVREYNKIINNPDSIEDGKLAERGAIISSLSSFERQNCMLARLKSGEI